MSRVGLGHAEADITMSILIFIVGLIWGSLSAQFFVQAVVSFVITVLYFVGLLLSSVSKIDNALATGVALFQVAIVGVLFFGGNWFVSDYIDYDTWNAASIGSVVSFLATIAYVVPQISGKIMFANMCAWIPQFREEANTLPSDYRIDFARKYRKQAKGG
jgi:hypothetical protein